MAVYKVRHEETSVGFFDVEADNVDDAIERFRKKYEDEGVDLSRMEVVREHDTASNSNDIPAMDKHANAVSIARQVLALVNIFGDNSEFATTIASDHKTLQQSVMRLFIATIREMANVTPDARNEQTVELAKKIIEIADGYSLPLI